MRCLARDPSRLRGRSWSAQVEVVQGNVAIPSTLPAALEGVHTAYYFVHNMSYGHGYTELELVSARAFAEAARQAGIEHIIYLGGLADPEQAIAPHMRSRIETGRVLREGRVPVTEFRTGVIAGSGSISFEMIRFMTELFPVIPGPLWMKNKAQPIAIQNVIDYLLAALTNPRGRGQVFEIGGPDIKPYRDLMLDYARLRGLKRRMLLFPGIPLWFMAFGVHLMTPVPYPIAYALIHGLSADSVVRHPAALDVFPEVRLVDYQSATRDALENTHPRFIERVWDDGRWETKSIKHEGCFIYHCEKMLNAEPAKVLDAAKQMACSAGWRLEAEQPDRILVCFMEHVAGKGWIEWRVRHLEGMTHLSQTVYFAPNGLPGFLYWFFLYPFHLIRYRRWIQSIAEHGQRP